MKDFIIFFSVRVVVLCSVKKRAFFAPCSVILKSDKLPESVFESTLWFVAFVKSQMCKVIASAFFAVILSPRDLFCGMTASIVTFFCPVDSGSCIFFRVTDFPRASTNNVVFKIIFHLFFLLLNEKKQTGSMAWNPAAIVFIHFLQENSARIRTLFLWQ